MNQNKDFYYKIEAYLCDGLSPSEKKAFEHEIAFDPQLKRQVEMQRLEWDGMESLVETDLRNKMDDWDTEMPFEMPTLAVVKPLIAPAEPKIVPMRHDYRWSIAASLVLAVGALIWLWQSKSPSETPIAHVEPPKSTELPIEPPKSPVESPKTLPAPPATAQVKPVPPNTLPESPKKPSVQPPKQVETPPQIVQVTPEPVITPPSPVPNSQDYAALAETNYKTDPFEVTESTRSNEPTAQLTPVEKAYQQGDFKQVVSLLKATTIDKAHVTELNLLAHAYFQQKQFANAQPLFEKMVDWNRLLARREAEWYLLLTYLAQCPKSQSQFDALAQQIKTNPQHEYYSKVITLLETIKKK
jgi:hypothetical protein